MNNLITQNFRVLMAKQFLNLLNIGANSYLPDDRKSYIYAIIGKQTPWNTGTEVIPTPGESIDELNEYWRRAYGARVASLVNANLVVPRINWTSNTVYNTYESTTNFYVKNSSDQVFKCLNNNEGVVSTSEPLLTLSTTSMEEPYMMTADGYKWKYLYTISSFQKQWFMDENWMPALTNKFVRDASINGSIDIVNITNSGNNYVNGPVQNIITVEGDGTGAILKANVSGGQIQDIIIQDRGSNYTRANVSFTDVSGGVGLNASAEILISPQDGHGYAPEYELRANNIMFCIQFEGPGPDSIYPTDNDFREVMLVSNPKIVSTNALATDEFYSLYTTINTSPGIGDFNNDEIVFQGITYGASTFSADVLSFDEVKNELYVNNVKGTISLNQALKGFTSGATRVATRIASPSMKLYSGKTLIVSDKAKISRDNNQIDKIRFIVSF
jgi:hypothetical protein